MLLGQGGKTLRKIGIRPLAVPFVAAQALHRLVFWERAASPTGLCWRACIPADYSGCLRFQAIRPSLG